MGFELFIYLLIVSVQLKLIIAFFDSFSRDSPPHTVVLSAPNK